MNFSIKDFFSIYDQIRRKLANSSHLLKKSLKENFIFCTVATVKYRKDNWDTNIQYTRQIFQYVDTNIAWAKTFSTFPKNIALQKTCKNDQFSTKNFSHFLCLKSVGSFQLNSVNGRNRCYEIFSNFTIGLFL